MPVSTETPPLSHAIIRPVHLAVSTCLPSITLSLPASPYQSPRTPCNTIPPPARRPSNNAIFLFVFYIITSNFSFPCGTAIRDPSASRASIHETSSIIPSCCVHLQIHLSHSQIAHLMPLSQAPSVPSPPPSKAARLSRPHISLPSALSPIPSFSLFSPDEIVDYPLASSPSPPPNY